MTANTRLAAAEILAQAARGEHPAFGPRLAVIAGPDRGRVFPLCHGDTLGRAPSAAVALRDPAASRRHVRIERDRGGLAIVDLGSKNGVELNGRRVSSRAPLRDGDQIRVGATLLEAAGVAPSPSRADAPRSIGADAPGAGLSLPRSGSRAAQEVSRSGAARQLRAGAALLLLAGAALAAAVL